MLNPDNYKIEDRAVTLLHRIKSEPQQSTQESTDVKITFADYEKLM